MGIADGPTEVHKVTVAKQVLKDYTPDNDLFPAQYHPCPSCGHGSFFAHRAANDWVGRVIGVLTLTPYDAWKRSHSIHHGTSGNLDKRGIGDLQTLTVREYRALSWARRLAYRLYRNPVILFGIGPIYMFGWRHRFPIGTKLANWRGWISPMATNLGIAAVVLAAMWLVGWKTFLLTQVPITLIAGSIGIWLFFIQHQFEDTVWAGGATASRSSCATCRNGRWPSMPRCGAGRDRHAAERLVDRAGAGIRPDRFRHQGRHRRRRAAGAHREHLVNCPT
jgi:hypothetical protein